MRETDIRRARNGLTRTPARAKAPTADVRPVRTGEWCDFSDLAADTCHHCKEIAMSDQLNAAYRERAHLVAFLTVLYPAVIVIDGDPDAPGWALVYVDSPQGQLSWHLSGDDLDLFSHVKRVEASEVTWDNHTTEEKYQRIRQLTTDLSAFLLPEAGR